MTKLEEELKEARNQAEEADKKYDEVAKKLAQVHNIVSLPLNEYSVLILHLFLQLQNFKIMITSYILQIRIFIKINLFCNVRLKVTWKELKKGQKQVTFLHFRLSFFKNKIVCFVLG